MKYIEPQNQATDLIELLKLEFEKRLSKNPHYSLRALARHLGIDASLLSKLLKKERKLTNATQTTISDFLMLPPQQKSEHNHPQSSLAKYYFIEEDQFHLISEWYHFALLELIKTKKFILDTRWIADKLDLTIHQVTLALERLVRLGYIEIKNKKVTLKRHSNSWLDEQQTNIGRKKLQKELLYKGIEALDSTPFEKRDISSLTVAVNPRHLSKIKEKIKEFRRGLDKYIQNLGGETEVYNLSIAFIPLTKTNTNRGKGERS